MSDILSQAEIEALLGGEPDDEESENTEVVNESERIIELTSDQKDVLGEIGNISMGTAATTLFALLNQKVLITTPNVKILKWAALSGMYDRPCVGVRVDYKEGVIGSNILVLRNKDTRVISNLMMGGDGLVDEDADLTELDLSAIGEAMNQMVGSASTSMSSMLEKKIDIDTPHAFVLDFSDDSFFDSVGYAPDDAIACVSFKMEIGTLINSELMQIYPLEFAEEVINIMMPKTDTIQPDSTTAEGPTGSAPAQQPAAMPSAQPYASTPMRQYHPENVNIQPAQFQGFDAGDVMQQKENIEIIMDVPLEVSVELGRTNKKIREILEFSPGSVIELDKQAGEPIDILVNGKFVAKGEVVVIDENFGIRITDIISPDKRI